ncbi:hypothetical protein FLJC2902T_12710 [Flavobacterium limnosediminis JC2902]|uniref:Uncharacterized protein n=1 Tax=Flavobacterium limnosediminis JC2902 TaxID=1341181 RepID=V6SWA5_9FLAO|nr:hypothetical protein [Flavobacterium limnosediminis]ESU28680.1 hypothetical protein FLJC2902T_12710 [Flavobacterium limnosediminis JC2902]
MANLEWFPINPLLKENGAFYSLSFEKEADLLKPVALTDADSPFSQAEVFQRSLNLQTAADLGVVVGNANANFKSFCFSYEAMMFTDKIVSNPIGGKIYGTRWGAGLRVILNVTDLKTSADFKFGALAASAELGLAKVEYRINTIGFNNPAIFKLLPGPGEFNFDTYTKILDAADKVKKYMSENPDKLTPQPFQVYMSTEVNNDAYVTSRSVIFAARCVSNRDTLAEAFSKSNGKYNADLIRGFYAKIGIVDENSKPSREDRREADDYLEA